MLTNQMVIFIPYVFINPALFFTVTSLKIFEPVKQKLETLGAIALLINIPGSIYLHDLSIQYDIPLHFAAGWIAFFAINSAMPLLIKNVRWTPAAGIFLVIAGGLALEGIQKLSDIIFGTQLFFDVRQPAALDFTIDVLMNALGALTAAMRQNFAKRVS